MSPINSPITFSCGKVMKNRFMLAPLTNQQSHEDGSLSDAELRWLTMRAQGGFGMVMTCAAHVQAIGKGFKGQLGIFSNNLKPGHEKLTKAIKSYGSLAVIQLHHAGMRSPYEVIKAKAVCPSEHKKYNARALSLEEVHQLREDFIEAAVRSKDCGYDGVEVHGAHGYILTQFLSAEINQRKDDYGGTLENRARLLFEIVNGIRAHCGSDFLLGVRLSPERFGMKLHEIKQVAQKLIDEAQIDFLDLSLWDCFKTPEDDPNRDLSLLDHILELNYRKVKLTVAGQIRTGKDIERVRNAGVDFVTIGRAAILHHDFPKRVINNPQFTPIHLPVSHAYLEKEGLSPIFINYMKRWEGFVKNE